MHTRGGKERLRAVVGSPCPIDFQIGGGGGTNEGGTSENLGQRTPILKINTT